MESPDTAMSPPTSHRDEWLAGGALALALIILAATRIHDLDHGFTVATGRAILAHGGLPANEVLVPALAERPFTTLWVIPAVLFALAWNAAGPAGIVLLKALCYGRAFLFAWTGARRRGTGPWLACAVCALCATLAAPRFVERAGMFSALLLGLSLTVIARAPASRRDAARCAATIAAISLAWSWCHAEWWVGLLVIALVSLDTMRAHRPLWAAMMAAAILPPLVSFAVLHPSRVRPLLAPFDVVTGGGADFAIAEYSMRTWLSMPAAILLPLLALATAVACWRRGLQGEAAALAILAVLCVKVPRAVLPLAIVLAPALAHALQVSAPTPARWARPVLAGGMALLMPLAWVAATPWARWGFALSPSLDTRGVGAVLDRVASREGPIMASYGMASLLLSNEGAARQGVVMDGRQEAYSGDYWKQTYLAMLSSAKAIDESPAAFWFEPWNAGPGDREYGWQLRRLGWQLVGWDNAGWLYARGGIARRHGMSALQFDLHDLDDVFTNPMRFHAAYAEVAAHVRDLAAEGLPVDRGAVVGARLAARIGRLEEAKEFLRMAAGNRDAAWHLAQGEVCAAGADWPGAEQAAAKAEALGARDGAAMLRAQSAMLRGEPLEARAILERAAINASPESAAAIRKMLKGRSLAAPGASEE